MRYLKNKSHVYLPDSLFLTSGHAQAALGVSRSVLYKWRKNKDFPPFHRSGKTSFYITSQLEAWLLNRNIKVETIAGCHNDLR